MHIDIKEYLSGFKNVEIDYIANPGNGGDALISAGTYQLFDSVGLT